LPVLDRSAKILLMGRRGWLLFGAMGLVWGIPYFLIRVAVRQLDPAVVVFGRAIIASAVLTILARRTNALRLALQRWRPVLAFALVEMAVPWILLTTAEQHLASGLTALIIASVPMVGAVTAFCLGDRLALRPVRLVGIAVGLAGVGLLVDRDLRGDSAPPWWSVAAVLLVVICYATAPFIVQRKLAEVPSFGVIAVSLWVVGIIYAPIAAVSLPNHAPNVNALLAVLGLGLICTALAFVIFFRLIDAVGAARGGLITFANPVVAVALGAVFLDELVTLVTIIGSALVAIGCWLATRPNPVVEAQESDFIAVG
jgi:drug/metabolite transporter (DMT)-like permease